MLNWSIHISVDSETCWDLSYEVPSGPAFYFFAKSHLVIEIKAKKGGKKDGTTAQKRIDCTIYAPITPVDILEPIGDTL